MKRAVLHIALLIIGFIAVGAHQTTPPQSVLGTWQFRAPMPEARSGATAVAFGDFIYVLGGKTTSGTVSNRVDRYHPATDTWDVAEPLQEARFNAASVVWNNSIVVLGGRGSDGQTLNSVEQLNADAANWAFLQSLQQAREGHTSVVLDGTIYAAGGSDALGRIFDSVEEYNGDLNSWNTSTQWELDVPRASFAMAAVNDSAFAIGGFNTFGPLGFVQRFHPVDGTAGREGLAPARGGLAAAFKGDRVFALGGITASNQAVSATDIYFPAENIWLAESPMNTPRAQFPAVVFGNDLYVFGGEDALGTITETVEIFISGVPPSAADDAFATNEDVPITFNVLTNDSDPAGLALFISSVSKPPGGSVVQASSEGALTYTPDKDFNGTDRFTYTIVNEEGSVATAEAVITVFPVNDPPTFASTPVTAGVTGLVYEYNVHVQDVDGPNVTITGDTVPGWLMLTDNGNGQAVLSGIPAALDAGEHLVSLRGSDGIAEQVQSFFITVVEGVPPIPMLLTPVNGADSVDIPVLFSWSELGATSWDFQLSSNDQFTNILINAPNLSEPSFEEEQLEINTRYYWRVRALNGAGSSDWSVPFSFTSSSVASTSNEEEVPRSSFTLLPPYPNPSTGNVWIEVENEFVSAEHLNLSVYDLRGRLIATLFDGVPSIGRTQFVWNGTNEWGRTVASGTYFFRLTHKDQQRIKSVVLVR
ncbi:MAG: cadherin-like domain-containing protein [Rhodothermaceae bacterium]|nr:cadherin-like domain-containing protein [Rhodothermaceae bacterium]